MEPDRRNWWHRLMERVKGTGHDDSNGLPAVGDDGLLVEPVQSEKDTDDKAAGLSRWSRREGAIAQLQEGYERVNQLMVDMKQHMADQSARSERICGAIEQLTRAMTDLPALSREQARALESIAGQLEASRGDTQQLTEAMAEIPKAARSQTDALTGMNSRLDMMNEQNVVGTQVMEKLQSAVTSVGQAGQVQTELLKQLEARAGEHNQRLGELLTGQSRRFTILFAITVALAVIALAAAAAAIILGSR
ncbi:MAG TPA: hypothetical protein VLM89_01915 [Phycisphaerae bacterium]|nr:hypothetical protein [Phycisphaerae bacterium]